MELPDFGIPGSYANRGTIDIPAFVVDELRRATRGTGVVENANDLLIDAADGLRVTTLHPDVLLFSNLAAHLPPVLLRPDRAMTVGR